MQLSVDVIIVQPPQVVGKPFVPYRQQPEKGGLARALTAHQTEHDLKLAAGSVCPVDRAQKKELQGFAGVGVRCGSQKVPQTEAYALRPVPYQTVQVVPYGVVAVLMGGKVGSVRNLPLAGQTVGFFEVQPDIFHIRVGHGRAVWTLAADGLYKICSVGQKVVGQRPGKQGVILEYGQAVPYAVADAALFGGVQHRLYFLNVPHRRGAVRRVPHGLPNPRRQVLKFFAQSLSLPFRTL